MPSETMDLKCFPSSSFFSDDSQVGFWQLDAPANHGGRQRPVAIDRNAVGAERAVKRSATTSRLLEDNTVHPMPYFGQNNIIGAKYENNLFSSSSSDLFGQNLRSSLNNSYGQSADIVGSHSEEEEPLNLLPDDDELLSGITEGLEHIIQSNGGDDLEELDLFSSIGGMDLGPGSQSCLANSGYSQGMLNFDTRVIRSSNPQSLPQYQNSLSNCSFSSTLTANINPRPAERLDNKQQLGRGSSYGHLAELNEGVFGSPGIGSCPLPGHQYPWSSSFHNHPHELMWSNSPSASFANGLYTNGMYTAHSSQRLYGLPKTPYHVLKPVLSANNLHVGSDPLIDPSIWHGRHSYSSGQSPEASGFHPGSLGNMRISNNSLHSAELASKNFIPRNSGNGMEMPVPLKNVGLQPHHRMMNSFGSHSERVRGRRSEGDSNHTDRRKQYELDIERIKLGEDNRTTLMIKNIPNKYTSKMLLAAIDERHRGTYDFLYLPIDFKNKCNVGYAFINMTDPSHIVPFYQAFNGKKWEKFNSEKVASIAYARIQGKAALISHFQNSSLMNEDKRHRPILFNTDGPNPGDQVPFPMGVNIRTRPGKTRATTREENHRGNSPNRGSKEVFYNVDSSSASGRESD